MAIGRDFSRLEGILGYTFKNSSLIETALTHTSYTNEFKSKGINYKSNERLEFLGDAVLQIVISELLYNNFEKYDEGTLTKMRQHLVCQKTLAKIAAEINLSEYLNVGSGEEGTGCRNRPRIMANALEAVIGAIYKDATTNKAEYKTPILRLFYGEIEEAENMQKGDYKSILQKLVEKSGDDTLEYITEEEIGPDHDKSFTVVAKINSNVVGKGTAQRLKDAQMEAAKMALSLFGIEV